MTRKKPVLSMAAVLVLQDGSRQFCKEKQIANLWPGLRLEELLSVACACVKVCVCVEGRVAAYLQKHSGVIICTVTD